MTTQDEPGGDRLTLETAAATRHRAVERERQARRAIDHEVTASGISELVWSVVYLREAEHADQAVLAYRERLPAPRDPRACSDCGALDCMVSHISDEDIDNLFGDGAAASVEGERLPASDDGPRLNTGGVYGTHLVLPPGWELDTTADGEWRVSDGDACAFEGDDAEGLTRRAWMQWARGERGPTEGASGAGKQGDKTSDGYTDPARWAWCEENDAWQGPGDHVVEIDELLATLIITDWHDVAEAPLDVVRRALAKVDSERPPTGGASPEPADETPPMGWELCEVGTPADSWYCREAADDDGVFRGTTTEVWRTKVDAVAEAREISGVRSEGRAPEKRATHQEPPTDPSPDESSAIVCPGCSKTRPGKDVYDAAISSHNWVPFYQAHGLYDPCCNPECEGMRGTGCYHCHHPRYFVAETVEDIGRPLGDELAEKMASVMHVSPGPIVPDAPGLWWYTNYEGRELVAEVELHGDRLRFCATDGTLNWPVDDARGKWGGRCLRGVPASDANGPCLQLPDQGLDIQVSHAWTLTAHEDGDGGLSSVTVARAGDKRISAEARLRALIGAVESVLSGSLSIDWLTANEVNGKARKAVSELRAALDAAKVEDPPEPA